MLQPASEEQQKIVDALAENNVVVNSVAGSGKTTTILHICKRYSSGKILVLTYNKLLKEETREKAEKLKLDNVEIHSFHAAAVKYLHHDCHNDLMLLKHLNARLKELGVDTTAEFAPKQEDVDATANDCPADVNSRESSSSDEEQSSAPNNLHLLGKLQKLSALGNKNSGSTGIQRGYREARPKVKPEFDIIVIDECQDMTHLYYKFICFLIREAWGGNVSIGNPNKRFCVLGDVKQCIYEFKEADDRFLSLAHKVFNFNMVSHTPWVQLQLTESFRINSHMANFVTTCLLSAEATPRVIVSRKTGPKVTYLIYDPFKHLHTFVASLIHKRLNSQHQNKLSPNDIFILAPSVKISNAKNPLKLLANKLSSYGYNIFMPNNDDEKLNENEILNKITFCTYHQAKGRERRLVLVMNFENNLFTLHNFKNHDSRILPNEIYVATTRATEELILLQNCKSMPFKFLNLDLRSLCNGSKPRSAKVSTFQTETLAKVETADFLDVYCLGKYEPAVKAAQSEEYQIVTELIRFLNSEILAQLEQMYEKREIHPAIKKAISLNKSIKNRAYTQSNKGAPNSSYIENVSAINGIAIPAFYELVKRGSMTINAELNKRVTGGECNSHNKDNVLGGKIKIFGKNYDLVHSSENNSRGGTDDQKKQILVENILYKSTLFSAFKSGLLFKLEQIKRYDWLSYDDFMRCFENFDKHTNKYEFKHEVFVQKTEKEITKIPLVITGFIDAVDQHGDLWEFKCTSELQPEHFLQIILYLYLRGCMLHPNLDRDCDCAHDIPPDYVTAPRKLYVFNVLNEHLYELYVSYKTAREIYLKIMIFRENRNKISEQEFLNKIEHHRRILTIVQG